MNYSREGIGTLTPFIPLSLRAFKGEGEIRTEGCIAALRQCIPLVQYWLEGKVRGMDRQHAAANAPSSIMVRREEMVRGLDKDCPPAYVSCSVQGEAEGKQNGERWLIALMRCY